MVGFIASGTNSQITHTYYDSQPATGGGIHALTQNNLRKRVSVSTYKENQADTVEHATYYNYDLDGNVSTLYQQVAGLGIKQIDYEYDLVSGKVNFVRYQDGKPDRFYYRYEYDADNRLTDAWSGISAVVDQYAGSKLLPAYRKLDAHYRYYLHGPLARLELGDEYGKVQGIDYAYTLQGWLKGVNGNTLTAASEIGGDGIAGNNNNVARDAYAYSLGYYGNDYKPIGTGTTALSLNFASTAGDITGQNLYNGNIASSTLAIGTLNSGNLVGYTYHYDQLNRLKQSRQHNSLSGTSWNSSSITQAYAESFTYDGNGNLLTQKRNGSSTTSTTAVDNLTYGHNYTSGRLTDNRLNSLQNGTTNYGYTYDAIGERTSDAKNGLSNITWTVYGKLQSLTGSASISYTYNAAGQRVTKTVGSLSTYYVRDAQGNTLALYDNAGGHSNWREQHLYGSSRLGIWTPNVNLATGNAQAVYDTLGRKFFELTNHLDNVLATISDRRVQHTTDNTTVDYYQPDIITTSDTYSGGMEQPGRSFNSASYRYGFNGKENDKDVATGYQNYGAREYDQLSGRFISVDPLTTQYPELTPYQFSGDNPIRYIDLDGLEPTDPEYYKKYNQAQDIRNLVSDANKAVIGYVTRIENTDEALKRSWQYATGQPPSFPMRMKMGFSAFMLNSQTANHLVNPAQIGKDAYEDYKGGHYVMGTLGVLAIIPGLEELKLSKYAKFGKCTEFVAETFSKINKAVTKAGGTVEKFEINIGKDGLIGTFDQQLSNNGMHQFLEVTKEGKTVIIDNLHPQGIAKEEYIKSLEGVVIKNRSVEKHVSGADLIENYTKKID